MFLLCGRAAELSALHSCVFWDHLSAAVDQQRLHKGHWSPIREGENSGLSYDVFQCFISQYNSLQDSTHYCYQYQQQHVLAIYNINTCCSWSFILLRRAGGKYVQVKKVLQTKPNKAEPKSLEKAWVVEMWYEDEIKRYTTSKIAFL